jgi:uncharacterized damage-inducible protein DinB
MTESTDVLRPQSADVAGERADLLAALAHARRFLRLTTRDLDDDAARRPTTVSTLTLGGLIKHVTAVEERWASFIVDGPSVFPPVDANSYDNHARSFRMEDGETLAGLLDRYQAVAAATDALVMLVPDLDAAHPLPEAPWFEAGASWSARRVILHIAAETTQHAGHADIIREALDGARSMG